MKTKMVMKWAAAAALACITTTLSAQLQLSSTTLAKDTNYTGADKVGDTVTINGHAYTDVLRSGAGLSVSGSQLAITSDNTVYRAFDNSADNLKLSSLQVGESLSLKLNLAITNGTIFTNHSIGFGFASADSGVAYIFDNFGQGYSNSGFYYRNGSRYMTEGNGAASVGQTWNGNTKEVSLRDLAAHDVTFTIEAMTGGQYTFSWFMSASDGSAKLISSQLLTWNSAMVDKEITGITFRGNNTSYVLNSLEITRTYLDMVPEPSALFLLGAGVALLAVLRRRK